MFADQFTILVQGQRTCTRWRSP